MKNPGTMTNRELYTEFEHADRNSPERYQIVGEMAKRLHMTVIPGTGTVAAEFRHWKLNGAGDQVY